MEQTHRFAICIDDHEGVDLDLLKVYSVLDDTDAEQTGMLRIIDESGEDYLHEAERFIVITLPMGNAQALLHVMEAPDATQH